MRSVPLFAVLVFAFITAAFAQTRPITEAELTKLHAAAHEKKKGRSVRIKTKTRGYKSGDSYELLHEFGSGDAEHYVYVRRVGGVETRREVISIGAVRYARRPDGGWIREPAGDSSSGAGIGMGSGNGVSGPPPEVITEYLYVGTDRIDGQDAVRYRKARTVTFKALTPIRIRRVVDEYWFRSDGLLVKKTYSDAFDNSKQRYESQTVYDYNTPIKITAPIKER